MASNCASIDMLMYFPGSTTEKNLFIALIQNQAHRFPKILKFFNHATSFRNKFPICSRKPVTDSDVLKDCSEMYANLNGDRRLLKRNVTFSIEQTTHHSITVVP